MSVRQDLFTYTVAQLRRGMTQDELSEELNRCVEAARETGKPAKLTLELTVKPQGASGQYILTDRINAKLPKPEREATLLFGTPEGNLQREDPRQARLPLRQVDDDRPNEMKKV